MRDWLSIPARNVPSYSIMEIARYASRFGYQDLVSLNIGEPDFDTPENVRAAAIEAIQKGYTHYTADMGLQPLREAISRKLQAENGATYPASNIIVVAGSQEGISVLSKALFDQGDEVILSDPYYPSYVQNIALQGAKPVFVPLRPETGYQMTADDVGRAVTPKTKAIIVVSPNNPTGGVQTVEELRGIAEIAQQNDLAVISDEIYEHLTYTDLKHVSIASLPGMAERTIVQNGFSKAYAMTGWRIGYMAAPAELIPKLEEIHRATIICPPSVSQHAALAALTGPQNSVLTMREEFGRRRKFVAERLGEIRDIGIALPAGAFYVFPDFSSYEKDDEKLAKDLIREAHVATVHGSGFGSHGKGHLRISYAASMEKLQDGLDRIEAHLKSLR